MPPSSRLIWYESASPLHMTQNFLTLGWWNLVGRQGWLSKLLKLHHVAHLWWVLMFDTFLYWSQLQPVMKCNQPYTAERRNMLGNMSPRNRRFAKTGTLHPEARHIVCQLSVIDNWVVSRCICPLIRGLSFEEMCSIHKYNLRGIILMINTSSQE